MTTYLWITARQRPFPFDLDELKWPMFSCNYDAYAIGPVADWEGDLATLITGAGQGTLGVDLFKSALLGSRPSGVTIFTQIIDTGGTSPVETHDGDVFERLSAQIIVRASTYPAARTRALAIWRALDGYRNSTVAA